MPISTFRWIIATILVAGALGVGSIVFFRWSSKVPEPTTEKNVGQEGSARRSVIGTSVEGRMIEAFTYGTGTTTKLLFVGGIHGGYEWNSVLLAYAFMDYLDANPNAIPTNLTLTVIPSANPDGVYRIIKREGRFFATGAPVKEKTVSGRVNAHDVDLNRNFDCNWKATSTWQGNIVSAGSAPFSEPEAKAIRSFVLNSHPDAVIFWHSQAGAVYASECKNGILPKTLDIMNAYAGAATYSAVESFDSYEITGDSEGWLASIGIPAITVELQTHETIEWERNLAGIKALFAYYTRREGGRP